MVLGIKAKALGTVSEHLPLSSFPVCIINLFTKGDSKMPVVPAHSFLPPCAKISHPQNLLGLGSIHPHCGGEEMELRKAKPLGAVQQAAEQGQRGLA